MCILSAVSIDVILVAVHVMSAAMVVVVAFAVNIAAALLAAAPPVGFISVVGVGPRCVAFFVPYSRLYYHSAS